MNSVNEPQARWVAGFGQAWRAPFAANAFFDWIRPQLRADYQFRQPLTRGTGTGLTQLRRRFIRPLIPVLPDGGGPVESWAANGETVFVELTLDARVGRRRVRLRACDKLTLAEGLAKERRTYVDPLLLIAAVVRSPRLRVSVLRWRLDEAAGRTA